MAHNITKIDGEGAMFCAGERTSAWHSLGQRTPDVVTWQEAMQAAKLDWPVVLKDLYSRDTNNAVTKIEDFKSVWRGNGSPACLGVVGKDFQPIQDQEAFGFCDALLGASEGAHYESAGALGMGRRFGFWQGCLERISGSRGPRIRAKAI